MADKMGEQHSNSITLTQKNWERYQYGKDRGHRDYVIVGKENEDFYLGGGLQWKDSDRIKLEAVKRPVIENNFVFPAVNTAIGIQLQSRVDIAFKPRRGGATEDVATTLSKLTRQICDDIKFKWLESQVFADGMIQQRGFYDFRVNFDTNMQGDITGYELDPLDVIIDPDAQSYDPDRWQDVIVIRYLTVDDIEQLYGKAKAIEVDQMLSSVMNADLDEDYEGRSRFGNIEDAVFRDDYTDETGIKRVLVIDRQSRRLDLQKVVVYPTGDIVPMDGMSKEQIAAAEGDGACCSKRMNSRIRWTVSTADVLLHDDWSPYRTYTIVPYFPYFRRGRTRGMVDNAKSPQEAHNKLASQVIQILGSTANGGYLVEEDSLTNMSTADLEDVGAKTGIVVEYKKGSSKPEKIVANQLPTGFERILERNENAIKSITGMSDAVQGSDNRSISGVAKQSDQYMGQAQLGGPVNNLARTRHLVSMKILELVQDFYTENRIVLITDDTDISNIKQVPLEINAPTSAGEILNDLTLGEYHVVATDAPTQATFNDNQFTQAMDMRKEGIEIPDVSIIEMSSLSKKNEIASQISATAEQTDPTVEAKAESLLAAAEKSRAQAKKDIATIEKILAEVEKLKADTVGISVDGQYSAVQTAAAISQDPTVAPLADQLLRSAGYEDQDNPPIMPPQSGGTGYPEAYSTGGGGEIDLPPNTDPTTPVPVPEPGSPAEGQARGSETVRFEDNI